MTFRPSFSHVFQVDAALWMHTSVTTCTVRKCVQSSRNLVYIPCLHLSAIILLSIKRLVGLLIKRRWGEKAFHLQSFQNLNFLRGLIVLCVDTARTFTSRLSWKDAANMVMNSTHVAKQEARGWLRPVALLQQQMGGFCFHDAAQVRSLLGSAQMVL